MYNLSKKFAKSFLPKIKPNLSLDKGKIVRMFCEKKKPEEIKDKEENTENKQENTENQEEITSSAKKQWLYTYLRKLRRLSWILFKIGFYTYSSLLLANYLMYKKNTFVDQNLKFLKIDDLQRHVFTLIYFKNVIKDVKTRFNFRC